MFIHSRRFRNLTLFGLIFASVFLFGFNNNINTFAVITASTDRLPCVSKTPGTTECWIQTRDNADYGTYTEARVVVVLDAQNKFLGLKDCQFLYYASNGKDGGSDASPGKCYQFALKGINVGNQLSINSDGAVDGVQAYQFRLANQSSIKDINGGKYKAYGAGRGEGYYVFNILTGNYVLLPSNNDITDPYPISVLDGPNVSQYGPPGQGLSVAQAQVLRDSVTEVAKYESASVGAKCIDVLLDEKDRPIFRCYKPAGTLVYLDGTTLKTLPDGCVAFRPAGTVMDAGSSTTVVAKCVKATELSAIQALAVNKKSQSQAVIGPAKNVSFFDWFFGVIIFMITTIFWLINNSFIIVTWLLGLLTVFILRLNPAGTLNGNGASVLFELWRLVYGVANFILLIGFMWVGFGKILGVSGKGKSLQEYLTRLVIIAIGLNFTILGAASVVNIAQGVGEVMIYSRINLAGSIDTQLAPTTGNADVDNQAKVSAALIGNYLKAIGGSASLHCSTKNTKGTCDLSKSPGLDVGNFKNVTDILEKDLGAQIMILMSEIVFTAVMVGTIVVFWKLLKVGARRFITLIFLMVVSPIVLVGYFSDLGQLKKLADGWWKNFVSNVLMYPMAVGMLIVIGIFTGKMVDIFNNVSSTTSGANMFGIIDLRYVFSAVPALAQATGATATTNAQSLNAFPIGGAIMGGFALYLMAEFLDKFVTNAASEAVDGAGSWFSNLGKSKTADTTGKAGAVEGSEKQNEDVANKLKSSRGKGIFGTRIGYAGTGSVIGATFRATVAGPLGAVAGATLGGLAGKGVQIGANKLSNLASSFKSKVTNGGKGLVNNARSMLGSAGRTALALGGKGLSSSGQAIKNGGSNLMSRAGASVASFGLAARLLTSNPKDLPLRQRDQLIGPADTMASTRFGANQYVKNVGKEKVANLLNTQGDNLTPTARDNLKNAVENRVARDNRRIATDSGDVDTNNTRLTTNRASLNRPLSSSRNSGVNASESSSNNINEGNSNSPASLPRVQQAYSQPTNLTQSIPSRGDNGTGAVKARVTGVSVNNDTRDRPRTDNLKSTNLPEDNGRPQVTDFAQPVNTDSRNGFGSNLKPVFNPNKVGDDKVKEDVFQPTATVTGTVFTVPTQTTSSNSFAPNVSASISKPSTTQGISQSQTNPQPVRSVPLPTSSSSYQVASNTSTLSVAPSPASQASPNISNSESSPRQTQNNAVNQPTPNASQNNTSSNSNSTPPVRKIEIPQGARNGIVSPSPSFTSFNARQAQSLPDQPVGANSKK